MADIIKSKLRDNPFQQLKEQGDGDNPLYKQVNNVLDFLPTNSNPDYHFTPSGFTGPKGKISSFHNFPRFGYTNDITALVSFDDTDTEVGVDEIDNTTLTINDVPLLSLSSDGTKAEYNKQDSSDYVKGIATAGIFIFVLYILWGVWLILLRAGRMDCCFRACQSGQEKFTQSRRKRRGEIDDDDDDADEPVSTCCCYTCHETLASKGGCCTRHIFCGWMSGRSVKLPTKSSLTREQELKNSKTFIGKGVEKGVTSVSKMAKSAKDNVTNGGDETNEVNAGDGDAETAVTVIDKEYIQKRQKKARRTILVVRIVFLVASISLIVAAVVGMVKGWEGINGIVNSSKNTLQLVDGQLNDMIDGVDEYITTSELVKEKRSQFQQQIGLKEDVSSEEAEKTGWCPAASIADGKIDVQVPLAQLLLRGKLIKLAFTDNVESIKEEAGVAAQEATTNAVEDVRAKSVTVVTFLDDLPEDGIIAKVLGLKDSNVVSGLSNAMDDRERIDAIVEKLKELVKALVLRVTAEKLGGRTLQELPSQDALKEYALTKEGVNYTVLELDDNFDGQELVYGEYNLTELLSNDVTVALDVGAMSGEVTNRLRNVSQQLFDIFTKLRAGLSKASTQAQDAQDSLDSILPYYYVAVVFLCIVIFITLIFIVGVILAWKEKQPRLFRHMQDHILMPLFIVSGFLCWIFTVVFLTLGVLAGDFCFESPDVQVTKMLEQTLNRVSKIGFNFGSFYVNGCPAENEPKLMTITMNIVTSALNGVGQFLEVLSSVGSGPLAKACVFESEDANPIIALSELAFAISEHVRSSGAALISLADLLLCRSFNPLYTSLTYDIVCTSFVNMIAPMLWCLFIVSVCSMIMVTLRVAWHEFVPDGEDDFVDVSETEQVNAKIDVNGGEINEDVQNGDSAKDTKEGDPQAARVDDINDDDDNEQKNSKIDGDGGKIDASDGDVQNEDSVEENVIKDVVL